VVTWIWLAVALVVAAVALRSRAREVASPVPVLAPAAGGLGILAVYVASRGLVFPWYAPLYVVPLALGLTLAAGRSGRRALLAAWVVAGLAPFAADLAVSGYAVAASQPSAYRYFAVNARVRQYRAIAESLSRAYPGARLLTSEVGGLGAGFDGPLLDGAGLITPEALAYHPMRVPEQRSSGLYGAIPAEYVRAVRPELIVSMDVFAEEWMRADWTRDYRLYRRPLYVEEDLAAGAPATLWGSAATNVWVRRDLPPWSP
jgi:hypothetical protein